MQEQNEEEGVRQFVAPDRYVLRQHTLLSQARQSVAECAKVDQITIRYAKVTVAP